MRHHLRAALAGLAFVLLPSLALAQAAPAPFVERDGWVVKRTGLPYPVLVQKLEDAVKANRMGLVNFASASEGAKAQGFTIPGNPVVGVFRNDFARRMLAASLPAGIEAPIRFYVTENADGATLSWRTPSAVFAPYVAAGGAELKKIADELDPIFARIGEDATKP